MKEQRTTCVLYVTATCNLQCKYCYIDKSPVLIKIDKILEKSYQDDYYFTFMQKMFDKNILNRMEFWGGEPSYGLIRALPTVIKAVNYYPNLSEFFLSTNLTTSTCIDDILNFISQISKAFPERQFLFGLQLSIDGPLEINDFNRGEKVTERFTNNFSKLIFNIPTFLTKHQNVSFDVHFKPTLDNYAIRKLQTKEKIINYFQFLESYKNIADQYIHPGLNWSFDPALPNTAVPSPHTTEDGFLFYNFCHLINEILEENKTKSYFRWYRNIMPFSRPGCDSLPGSLAYGCLTCGSGRSVVGLLPNNLISGCHNGFVELLSEYKEHAPNQEDYQIDTKLFTNSFTNHMVFSEEEYQIYESQVQCYHEQSVFQTTELTALILQMAKAGQIQNKYINQQEAIEGAHFIHYVTSNCMRDNIGVAGSKYLQPLGFIRLFLNGAKEEIQKNAREYF